MIKHLFYLLFNPSKLVQIELRDRGKSAASPKIPTIEEQVTDRIKTLRNAIWKSFRITSFTFGASLLIKYIMFTLELKITPYTQRVLGIVGTFMLLWAVFGDATKKIATWDGTSVSERINERWFSFLQVIGTLFLFLALV